MLRYHSPNRRRIAALLLSAGLAATGATAQSVVHVPGDASTLQQALLRVDDGGVIELAAGTYEAPTNGFRLGNLQKAFTLRAAEGAVVVLDGGGTTPILRIQNANPSRGRRIVFEGLVFERGFSSAESVGGAVTLRSAEAVFRDCEWRDNLAINEGAAAAVFDSEATFVDGVFRDNRVNPPNHRPTSAGGAIYALNSELHVTGSLFERNEAGFAGGALYAFGTWGEDLEDPPTRVTLVRSTFRDNRVAADACCSPPGAGAGGAVHLEDHVRARIYASLFEDNAADHGGGVNMYRSRVSIQGSVFRGNRAVPTDGSQGSGGAIFAASVDFVDSSTDQGVLDRPRAELTLGGSLIAGQPGTTDSNNGGCITIAGDGNRQYGRGGVPQGGTLDSNRGLARIDASVLLDCQASKIGTGAGFGGGVHATLADLRISDTLFLSSAATGTGAAGGAIAMIQESSAIIESSHFAGNTTDGVGGAIFASSSYLDVSQSSFSGNDVLPGVAEPIQSSTGAAIYTSPTLGGAEPVVDARGSIRQCLFAENLGLPIREADLETGPINAMVYDGNRFTDSTFGAEVFVNTLVSFGGTTVSELNGLTVVRADGSSTRKSTLANVRLGSSPKEGRLLAVPPSLPPPSGSPGGVVSSRLAHALTGSGTATLDGMPLGSSWGATAATLPGERELFLDGTLLASAELLAAPCADSRFGLCLNGSRFFVDASWRDFQERRGLGRAVRLTDDTGYFWFFQDSNVETVLKVLDGTPLNDHYWLFYGALSNVDYQLFAVDLESGQTASYRNPLGQFGSLADTTAFPVDPGEAAATPVEELASAIRGEATCLGDTTHLCLQQNRFRAEVSWEDFQGNQGVGQAVSLTGDTGYFWFFRESNVELILKVLDGRGINGHFWVLYGALSSVPYELLVVDTETGAEWTFVNPANEIASGGDTEAFPDGP